MYRIELSPGEESVFRTIEELAVAIKRGVITPRARIWHNASSQWLPIQFHPHYKTAVSMELSQAALVAGPPVKPLSSLTLQHPAETEPPAAAFVPPAALPPEQAPVSRKKSRAGQPKPKPTRKRGQPRRQLRIALVGALLIGGAQWVLSAPLFSRAEVPEIIKAQRHLISVPTEAMNRVSLPNSAAVVPVASGAPATTAPASLEELTEPATGPTVPSFGGTGGMVESGTAEPIERAPDTINVMVPKVPSADSLRPRAGDSTAKR